MAIYNIQPHLRGNTFDGLQFEVIINGSPKDLTHTTIKIDFRRGSKTGVIEKSLTNGLGITITDPVHGIFKMDMILADMPSAIYYYDVLFIDGSVRKTYIEGTWAINQNVTNG